jgi:hypothetical protein
MTFLKWKPFHPIFFSMNPVLALLATNIAEVEMGVVARPLLLSVSFSLILLFLTWILFRDIQKAGLVTTFLLFLFFTYGHVYQMIELKELIGINIGRHRYLVLLYGVVGISGMLLILKRMRKYVEATLILNLAGIFLVVLPVVQITVFTYRISVGEDAATQLKEESLSSDMVLPDDLPDIYYIVLDTYTRADALRRDFNFDNSYFIEALEELGFYVADCSRSNYSYTQGTITSVLNMDYIPDLRDDLDSLGLGMEDIWVLMKQSLVRRKLEDVGYKTVAFETGYEWSQLHDADVYFSLGTNPYNLQMSNPFETMLIKSTAAIILTESPYWWMSERMKAINFPYSMYVQTQQSILSQLRELPSIEAPKFVFAHVLIPHVPYVFDPEGNIRDDPGYYGGSLAAPLSESYLMEGYTGEIRFINSMILEISAKIIHQSQPSPIIIVHGDHGLRDENRLQIFNAYYLPEGGNSLLYPNITPVNSFRVVFDTTFGTDYGLLVDESFLSDDIVNPVPETSLQCMEIPNTAH